MLRYVSRLLLNRHLHALMSFHSNPEERPSASELRKHDYLVLPPGWQFNGFT